MLKNAVDNEVKTKECNCA